ncbi:MAG: PHP domain-containing protein [Bernardetiaceae bacterium]|jgi:DNA polymerase (family 10)|nr:PHP domain-containing protein [Bernardetiaceae bacterium]
MSNKEIIRALRLTASLLEMDDANPFKIRAYTGAVFQLEKTEAPVAGLPKADLLALGFTDSMAEKLIALAQTGSLPELDQLRAQIPPGVVDVLGVKGLGAKKVKTLWQDLGIESLHQLREACQSGQVAQLKGFGEKTQAAILQELDFKEANADKLLFAEAEPLALALEQAVANSGLVRQVALSGQMRQAAEVVDTVQLVAQVDQAGPTAPLRRFLDQWPGLRPTEADSSPFAWRGHLVDEKGQPGLKVEVRLTDEATYAGTWLLTSAAPAHVARAGLAQPARTGQHLTEAAIYQAAGLPWVPPELREGGFEIELAQQQKLPTLLEMSDLRGILHNHSTYSDGKHTLAEMAQACRDLGYEYLGISDHSQSAFYANGLTADRVKRQHEEIAALNAQLAPFRIFKGIEADILNDGALDYPDEVLASFDFIVASIHSNLRMDREKATQRLLRAVANPYTTILGHPTGRLLLRREGYPIDHEAILQACAQHGVVVEINANPWRLDLDWRWVRRAIELGVRLSINPDAHEREGYADMRYGVLVARKGGAERAHVLNALPQAQIAEFFRAKRP